MRNAWRDRGWAKVLLGILLCFAAPGSAIAHDGVTPIPYSGDPTPEQVVADNGAATPDGSQASATLELALDILDPRLEYRIQLFGIDLAQDVESIQIRIGQPGSNGFHALNIYGTTGEHDDDLLIDFANNFLLGIWDDGDENLGGDGTRDPTDSVSLSDVAGELVTGQLYLSVTTHAYPFPDTAELRGQIAAVPQCSDGIDNDSDGLVDDQDPQCDDPEDDLENCDLSLDGDGDRVADECDNCTQHFNPVLGNPQFPTQAPPRQSFQTTTGGQLDDDGDGIGNACDAKFTAGGSVVGGSDLLQQLASFNKDRSGNDCGAPANQNCSQFDIDNFGQFIGGGDLSLARLLFNFPPGPSCAKCPLACEGPHCP